MTKDSYSINEVRRAFIYKAIRDALQKEGYTKYSLEIVKAAAKDLRTLDNEKRKKLSFYYEKIAKEFKQKDWNSFRAKWSS